MVLEKTTTINQSLNTQKGYMVSLALHAALFAGLTFFAVDEIKPIDIPMSIELDLSALSTMDVPSTPTVVPSSQASVSPITPSTPTVQQTAPIGKTESKNSAPMVSVSPSALVSATVAEKLFHSEPIASKAQPVSSNTETVATVAPKSVEVPKPLIAHKSDTELEKEFVKTNFGMIRDSVLSKLVYPNIARRMGQIGVVEVAMVIGTNGKLKNHFVSKSSGFPLLDEAALKAVATLGSELLPKPQVESRVILPISFKLKA